MTRYPGRRLATFIAQLGTLPSKITLIRVRPFFQTKKGAPMNSTGAAVYRSFPTVEFRGKKRR